MQPSDLTTGPVRPLLRSIALPAGIGMFCNTLFNLTDTFFAGRISTEAVAGLSISFPVFFLILATGAGLGTGTTALMANALGARQRDEARLLAAQAIPSVCWPPG
jgi:Na+-driven multidrug efflux pump